MNFNPKEIEKYSSAITLSDMEIFVFPDLLYSLVLASIMSPIVWEWKENKWFSKVKNKTRYRKVLRLKQFIMDNFEFNLDLETWGLTDSEKEIERFAPFIDVDMVRRSNALFGFGWELFTDSRIDAALILSPSAPRQNSPESAFDDVDTPWMLTTGTGDEAPIGEMDVEDRWQINLDE